MFDERRGLRDRRRLLVVALIVVGVIGLISPGGIDQRRVSDPSTERLLVGLTTPERQ